MATAPRPALRGSARKAEGDEEIREEIIDRDASLASEDQPSHDESIPADGASAAALAKNEDEPAKPAYEEDTARAAIIASYGKERGRGILEGEPGEDDDAGGEDAPPVEEPVKPEPVKAKAEPERILKLKVNGTEIELPESEVIARAQMDLAATQRLEDAKRQATEIIESARRSVAQPAAQPHQAEQQPPASRTTKTKVDPEELRSAVEAIQAGTPEEAEAALAGLLEAAQSSDEATPAPVDVRAAVSAELLDRDAQTEVTSALAAVAEKHTDLAAVSPEVAGDLAGIMANKAASEVMGHLRSVGYTDQELAGLRTYDEIMSSYARIRRDPTRDESFASRQKLPPIQDIFEKVATHVEANYVKPQSKPRTEEPGNRIAVVVSPERAARRTLVPQQPRSASARTDMTRVNQPAQRRDPSDVVADMAKARGQLSA